MNLDATVQFSYLAICGTLRAELAELHAMSGMQLRRDLGKFRGSHLTCSKCGEPLDWIAMLARGMPLNERHGDFDVRQLSHASTAIFCSCGTPVNEDACFQRGVSALSKTRRTLFQRCLQKLMEDHQLDALQAASVVRYLFRARILDDLTEAPPEAVPVSPKLQVDLKNVHRTFKLGSTEVKALRGIDLQIFSGEFIALVGASGAGKSTLMNLIACIDQPTSGTIALDGVDASHLSEGARARWRNRHIGFVFQTFNLIPVLNVFENVELPLLARHDMTTRDRRDRVLAAVDDVDLTALLRHRPDQLSGGERQRTAIARALVIEPSIVIADEPTANLDSRNAETIVRLMIEMNEQRGVTFVLSTHDESLIKRLHRTVEIVDGMIVPR